MGDRITPIDWETLVKVFEVIGFEHDRTKGDHYIMTRKGVARPVVIQKMKDLPPEMIKSNLRTAGLTSKEYFRILRSI